MSRRRRSRARSRRTGRAGRMAGMVLGLVGLLLVVGVLGGYLWLTGYLRSEKFLTLVNEKASAAVGAEVKVSRLLWDGMLVKSPAITVEGEDLLRRVEVEGLETEVELGSLIRRQVRTSPVYLKELFLAIETTGKPPEWQAGAGGGGFPGLVVENSSGEVSFGGPVLAWHGTRAEVNSGSGSGSYEFLLSGGEVETPVKLFPTGTVREMKARYSGRRLYLTKGEFGVYESGRLWLNGEVEFSDGRYSFEGKMEDVFGREMAPEDWKKRLEGTLTSDFTVRGKGKEAPVVQGHLEMVDGVITGLPILDRIAAYADTTRFRRLVLSEAELDFRQEGKRLELDDIVLASEGLMRIEGRLVVVDRKLDGVFRFGLTPGTLARIPGAETRVFLPGEEGLLWSDLRITGTLDDPREDLSRRLIVAAGARMFEVLPETGEKVLRNTKRKASEMALQALEAAPGVAEMGTNVVEQGSEVLRSGADLVSEGVNSALGFLPGGRSRELPPVEEKPEGEEQDDAEEEPSGEAPTSSP